MNNQANTSKLSGLVASAKAAGVEAQQQAQTAPKAKRVKKDPKNQEVRDVVVMRSETAKQAFLTTNLMFSSETLDRARDLLVRDMTPRAKGKRAETLGALLAADDMVVEQLHIGLDVNGVEIKKFEEHVRLESEGYNMISTRGAIPAGMTDPNEEARKAAAAEAKAAEKAAKAQAKAEEKARKEAEAAQAKADAAAAEETSTESEGFIEGAEQGTEA